MCITIKMMLALVVVFLLKLQIVSGQPNLVEELRIRLFWIRHGQSCANVLDRCAVGPKASSRLLPDLQRALRAIPNGRFHNASLNAAFGLQKATSEEPDCTIEIAGGALKAGEHGEEGAIVRVHDLYLDPALTNCARQQSVLAGRELLQWLNESGTRLDFVGSSFLMRAFETAYAMFFSPCTGGGGTLNCSGVLEADARVVPVPYMTERAPEGHTSIQADNTPRDVDDQTDMIEAAYGRKLPMNGHYATSWPRYAQQYEKFKAFLAAELVPKLTVIRTLAPAFAQAVSDSDAFQAALEASMPEAMHYEDVGKQPIHFEWAGGAYSTGPTFRKAEYAATKAPEVNIAIVGHNRMMIEYCQQGQPPKPNNNAVLEKLFILRVSNSTPDMRGAQFMLRELEGQCAKVMDAPSGADAMRSLVGVDVRGCKLPFDVSTFLGLDDDVSTGETACMKLASKPDAFPIQAEFTVGRDEL